MNIIIPILISNLITIAFMLFLFWKTWLPYLRPDWFFIFRIYQNDFLNYKEIIIFKPVYGDKDSYIFNKKEYSKKDVKPYISPNGVFTWNFKEGQLKPISFYGSVDSVDAKLIAQAKKITMDDIWFGTENFLDILQKYGIWIVIGLIIIFMIYITSQNQQTERILINLTSRFN